MTDEITPAEPVQPRWRPLSAIDRRVLGVLAEKAKTTPDIYPMSLNAIVTGCNQKSNRAPLMQLEGDDVEESLDRLREAGAVAMVEGYGRVTKYRHYLYDWLGVDKIELSVMTELLLRGAQSEGELRGRAARMDPIPDLTALRTLLNALRDKGLVISLTSEGRGHVVSHALYPPRELAQLQAQYGQAAIQHDTERFSAPREPSFAPAPAPAPSRPSAPAAGVAPAGPVQPTTTEEPWRREMESLSGKVAELTRQIDELTAQQDRMATELGELREALGG